MRLYPVLAALLVAAPCLDAQTITIATNPSSARIQTISDAGVWQVLGTGTAKFKLKKENANRVWVVAEGYDTLAYDFEAGKKYPKEGVVLTMNTRLVNVTALPYDAGIYENGELKARRLYHVKVPKGQPVTIEVRKEGFKPETRTYRWDALTDVTPVTDRFELKDRMVRVFSQPEGATFKVDGAVIASGKEANVVVPQNECVTVVAEKEGWNAENTRLCFRGTQVPPVEEAITFKDRMIAITTTPASATIKLGDRNVGQGSYNLLVPSRSCASVVITAAGYAGTKREYCDVDNPPSRVQVDLPADEAYSSSVQSDQANVNFTIEVGGAKTADQAWRTISQVVLGKFDVLEITDKETGYMRTSWEVTKFNHSIVRTRVIVKLGNSTPLKYIVKVASEHSDDENATVKDDEKFQEWDRLLNSYKDLVNELQARLR